MKGLFFGRMKMSPMIWLIAVRRVWCWRGIRGRRGAGSSGNREDRRENRNEEGNCGRNGREAEDYDLKAGRDLPGLQVMKGPRTTRPFGAEGALRQVDTPFSWPVLRWISASVFDSLAPARSGPWPFAAGKLLFSPPRAKIVSGSVFQFFSFWLVVLRSARSWVEARDSQAARSRQ